jgi:hypothetical protein
MSLVECLSFLFQLSFSQLGKVDGSLEFYIFLGLRILLSSTKNSKKNLDS